VNEVARMDHDHLRPRDARGDPRHDLGPKVAFLAADIPPLSGTCKIKGCLYVQKSTYITDQAPFLLRFFPFHFHSLRKKLKPHLSYCFSGG
jgi:hypothetical protein